MLAALQTGFRPREERITVLIPSRMRLGAKWVDVVIHNVSSRGLMAGCDTPPAPGSYVEIRRGTIVIVGRVMWQKDRFFGLRSQDRLSVQGLVNEPRLAQRPQQAKDSDQGERRADRRLAHEARLARSVERSRAFSSAFQFVIIALVGVSIAAAAAHSVYGMLQRPADAIGQALEGAAK